MNGVGFYVVVSDVVESGIRVVVVLFVACVEISFQG